MKASYKLVYNRKKQLNKKGEAVVQIEIYLNGKRKYISTEIYLKPSEWNDKKSEVDNSRPNCNELNHCLRKFMIDIERNELKLINQDKSYGLEDLHFKTNNENDFYEFVENEIKQSATCADTKRLYKRTLLNLKEIRKTLTFNQIDYTLIRDFEYLLRNKVKDDGKPLHHNTINKRHSTFKAFINMATKKGLIEKNKVLYNNFKISYTESQRLNLEPDEIERLEKLKFNEKSKDFEQIRDMFLFSCCTGLRFSDVAKLTKKDITTKDNQMYLNILQNKTKKYLELPLHLLFDGKAVKIIEKYKNTKHESVFPKTNNGKVNRILKMLAILANIDNNLSYHIARHTFGSMLAEYTGDPYLIKDLMSHSDIKTSMVYIHGSKKRMENRLKNVEWK